VLFFFHILTDIERLVDHEGGEFSSVEEAINEARQSVRSVIADQLTGGEQPSLNWALQIIDESGSVVKSILFGEMVSGAAQHTDRCHAPVTQAEISAQKVHDEIRMRISELRDSLRRLG
jgi:hypothetical protein